MTMLSSFTMQFIFVGLLILAPDANCYSRSLLRPISPSTFISKSTFAVRSTVSSDFPITSETSTKALVVPTILDLCKFGLPTLGIWLLQPILSLIDTSVIGMSAASASSVLELAALGPGIAWIDSSAYLCQFMGMATTNLYAIALSEGDVPKQRKVLSHATILSTALGLILFAIQYVYAKPIVTILAGSAVESIPYALAYSRIRSFASIIAVPTIVGQAAFLANKDSVTPLKAVLVGSVINVIGDLLLVCVLGKGIVGAAWATTLSQIGSAIYLLCASIRNTVESTKNDKGRANSNKLINRNAIPDQAKRDSLIDQKSSEVEGKTAVLEEGALLKAITKERNENDMKNLIQVPGIKDITSFLSFCGPLFFVLLMKAFSWSYTTYACSPAGSISLAAHQIVLNMFCIFAIFGDAVSQISQTYLPPFLGGKNINQKMYKDARSIIRNIMKMSFSMGLFNCIFSFLAVSKYGQKVST